MPKKSEKEIKAENCRKTASNIRKLEEKIAKAKRATATDAMKLEQEKHRYESLGYCPHSDDEEADNQ